LFKHEKYDSLTHAYRYLLQFHRGLHNLAYTNNKRLNAHVSSIMALNT